LKHLSPVAWEHISLTGDYIWNLKQATRLDALHHRGLNEGSSLLKVQNFDTMTSDPQEVTSIPKQQIILGESGGFWERHYYRPQSEHQRAEPKKEPRIMNARRALAGAVVSACALMASPAPLLANELFRCNAKDVAIFPKSFFGLEARIHVRCEPGDYTLTFLGGVPIPRNIEFFALSPADPADPDVNRLLALATTAVSTNRILLISYEQSDLAGKNFGCLSRDCRRIRALTLLNAFQD
jgi:hypothetical protein